MSICHEYFQCSHVLNRWGSLACWPPTMGSSSSHRLPFCLTDFSKPWECMGPTLPPSYCKAQISHSMGPFRGISETSCARTCHLLVSKSFLSKELSSSFLSQVAGCHLKRQLKSLTMAGLKSALTGLVRESLTLQRKLSLIMFRYVRRGIRLEERVHEIGV